MNAFKVMTMIDYSAWDLNTKCVHHRNRRSLENMFRRKARRAINAETRHMLKELFTNERFQGCQYYLYSLQILDELQDKPL